MLSGILPILKIQIYCYYIDIHWLIYPFSEVSVLSVVIDDHDLVLKPIVSTGDLP